MHKPRPTFFKGGSQLAASMTALFGSSTASLPFGSLYPVPRPHGYQFMPPRSQKKRRIRERRMRAAGRRVR